MTERSREESSSAAGRARFEEVYGARAGDAIAALEELDPALVEWGDAFVFGRVWQGPGLDTRERFLVAIAVLAALGRSAQLPNYLRGALDNGVSVEQLRQTILMLSVYAGFPVVSPALRILREIQTERENAPDNPPDEVAP